LAHKGRGKRSNKKINAETIDLVKKHLKEKYYNFGPTFAAEKLEETEK